jgi:hypothetical protein
MPYLTNERLCSWHCRAVTRFRGLQSIALSHIYGSGEIGSISGTFGQSLHRVVATDDLSGLRASGLGPTNDATMLDGPAAGRARVGPLFVRMSGRCRRHGAGDASTATNGCWRHLRLLLQLGCSGTPEQPGYLA